MKYKAILMVCFFFCTFNDTYSQKMEISNSRPYEDIAKQIISEGLKTCFSYSILKDLSLNIGHRLVGSHNARRAIEWSVGLMNDLGFQNVHLESCMVPHWVRGDVEDALVIMTSGEKVPLNICALGGSIATPIDGITAEVVQVRSFEELKSLGEKAKGKIVFFNRPMDPTKFNTFEAYGGAVNQRNEGAIEAAKVGGVAVLVRSITLRLDDVPHTGITNYVDTVRKIPAAAVSTKGANLLDSLLKTDPYLKVRIRLTSQMLGRVESANVIGELVGTEKPEEIIVIGGHLDSWDKGQGTHDDGAGCVHVIEALRLLKVLGLKPKRTIRAVLFMNEEFGLDGGIAYARKERGNEKHICAIESDAGGFMPRGFGIAADSVKFQKLAQWSYLLDIIDAGKITKGGGGADISELGKLGVVMIGLRVDTQRYFDYHHSDNDTFDKVHERELELGAIAIAIFSYVIAQEGI